MILTELPTEVLVKLFSYLHGKDIARVAQVCKRFFDASKVDSIWRSRCFKEFGVTNVDASAFTHREAYTKLLYKYGYTLGLWKAALVHYGGLVHVKFTGHKIEAVEYLAPGGSQVTKPLRIKPMFTIGSSDDGEVCQCNRGHQYTPHPAQILKVTPEGIDDKFWYKCCNSDLHTHPEGRHRGFIEWVQEENDDDIIPNSLNSTLFLRKYLAMVEFSGSLECSKLILPSHVDMVPIQPGLFKGTYGAHGIEIILLSYDSNKNHAIGQKITGDPNVPAGEVTIQADLKRAMILTREQQESITTLSEIDTPDVPPSINAQNMPKQPFVVPRDCWNRTENIAKTCTYRCHSQGQVADNGFNHPKFIPTHWVVFDEDTFGHVWIGLQSLSIYSRVKENLTHNQ